MPRGWAVYFGALLAECALLAGCMGSDLPSDQLATIGSPSGGMIHARGVPLPDSGPGFVRARPGEDTRFGMPSLIHAITNASAEVASTFPDTPAIRVGDLSSPYGGRHERHHSHRSGRDADLIYYSTDADGTPVDGAGFLAYDRFGIARDARDGTGPLQFLDEARNWQFMRTLLLDDENPVQWIFCSAGVKSRLLAYALAHETNPNALLRAAYVLHQPTDGRPHDDHFHIRLACTARTRADGCRDSGPVWAWIRADMSKPAPDLPDAYHDAALVRALMED